MFEINIGAEAHGWATVEVQDAVLRILDRLEESPLINSGWGGRGTHCWLRDFISVFLTDPANRDACNATSVVDGREAHFVECIEHFRAVTSAPIPAGVWPALLENGSAVAVGWHNDFGMLSSKITWSRCWGRHSKPYPVLERYEEALEMEAIRALVEAEGADQRAFAFQWDYRDLERYLGIMPSIWLTVGGALGACFIVSLFFLVSPTMVLVVVLMVACVDVSLFGLMAVWGITTNETSVVIVVMACGFAVDYSAHVAWAYMNASGSGDERATSAIVNSGRSIIHAGVTTLLVCPFLMLGAPMFQTFAKMLLGIVVFGLAYALMLLPVLLAAIDFSGASLQLATRYPPVEDGIGRAWHVTYRRYALTALMAAAAVMIPVATETVWSQYSGELSLSSLFSSSTGSLTFAFRSTYFVDRAELLVAECPRNNCGAGDLDWSTWATRTAATAGDDTLTAKLIASSSGPSLTLLVLGVTLGVAVLAVYLYSSHVAHGGDNGDRFSPWASPGRCSAATATAGAVSFAAYASFQAALAEYEDLHGPGAPSFVDPVTGATLYSKDLKRGSGHRAAMGATVCFLVAAMLLLLQRAEDAGGSDDIAAVVHGGDTTGMMSGPQISSEIPGRTEGIRAAMSDGHDGDGRLGYLMVQGTNSPTASDMPTTVAETQML